MTPTSSESRPTADGPAADPQPIRRLMERGIAAARAGQRERADACFEAVIQLDPRHSHAWLWRAGIAREPARSLEYVNHALSIDPHNEAARAGLEWARQRCQQQRAPSGKANRVSAGPSLEWLTIVTGILTILVLAIMAGLYLLSGDFATPAHAEMPPATQTATLIPAATMQAVAPIAPSATASATYTFTPAPTTTHTSTASPTPSPTPSPSPTPTAPFTPDPAIAPAPVAGEKWILVSLTEQHLLAYEGEQLVFEASVSTGLPQTPTVKGVFRIFRKLVSTTMSGPDYYLPNVLYTQYFYKGYALHGAYWHDNFGQPMSHGCINLREDDARWLFDWTAPAMPPDARSVQSSPDLAGTLVVIQ